MKESIWLLKESKHEPLLPADSFRDVLSVYSLELGVQLKKKTVPFDGLTQYELCAKLSEQRVEQEEWHFDTKASSFLGR